MRTPFKTKRSRRYAVAIAMVLLAACSDDGGRATSGASVGSAGGTAGTGSMTTGTSASGSSGTGTSATGTSSSTSGSAGTSGGSGDSGGSTGGGPTLPVCWQTCAVAADCALMNAGEEFDADNYACEDGLCVYQGCNDDQECKTFLPSRICHQAQGASFATCTEPCQTAQDCAAASQGTMASNWTCDGGGCVWLGCGGDSECPMGFVCRDSTQALFPEQTGVPGCVPECTVPADCDLGGGVLYDEDNYMCIEGGCAWSGCNSTAECSAGRVCQ